MHNADLKSFMEKQMELGGNSFHAWVSSASSLFQAADYLYPPAYARDARTGTPDPQGFKVWAPMLMLRGLAVENLLKGLAVKNGHQFFKEGRFQKLPGKEHDLVQLAAAVKFTLSESEKDVLKRLSYFALVVGRYPIPKRWDDGVVDLPGGKVDGRFWGGTDDAVFEQVLSRLFAELGVQTTTIQLPVMRVSSGDHDLR